MISIVLWGIEHPGNLGAIARLCANFAIKNLFLVEPKCTKDSEEARSRAKHAQNVLSNIRTIDASNLQSTFDLIIGTTAQVGTEFNIARSPLTPEQCAQKVVVDANVALVFGSEGMGLTNEQLDACDFVVTIETNPEYPTLNLSHAVAIMLYELFSRGSEPRHEMIPRIELDVMYDFLDEIIDALDFTTLEKRETQRIVWKKVFAKATITRREAQAMIGLLRKIKESVK